MANVNEPKSLLDAIHDNIKLVREFSYDMKRLARAAAIMGNRELAESLRFWTEPLQESAKEISDAWSTDLDAKIKHNNTMFGEVMKAALNVPDPH